MRDEVMPTLRGLMNTPEFATSQVNAAMLVPTAKMSDLYAQRTLEDQLRNTMAQSISREIHVTSQLTEAGYEIQSQAVILTPAQLDELLFQAYVEGHVGSFKPTSQWGLIDHDVPVYPWGAGDEK